MYSARLAFPAAKISSPRLLALVISASYGSFAVPAFAATTATTSTAATTSATATPATTGGAVSAAATGNGTETITVVAKPDNGFTPGGDRLVPAYLDGQIANGGRLGLLGEQSAQDVPFNVVGYTSKLMQDQQTRSLSDVLRNDASVQTTYGYGNIAKKLNYGYTDFMSYSIDFRRRILSIKKHEGLSIRETAKRFHIGTTTIVRWTKQIDARPATSRQRKIDKSALERDVEQYPDAYQRERAERFGVCQMAICKALKKLQLTYKKNSASSKSRRRR